MAIFFATGFEHGRAPDSARWSALPEIMTTLGPGPRTGARHARSTNNLRYNFETNISEVFVSMGICWIHTTNDIRLYQENGNYFRILLVSIDSTLYRRYYLQTTIVGTGTIPATLANVWEHLRINWLPADSGGFLQIKVDGEVDFELSGDTNPGTGSPASLINSLYLGGNTGLIYYDDIVLDDAEDPGDCRIVGINPDSDVAAAWTPSTGSDNYALVNVVPPSDATYVITATDALDDLYGLGDWSGSGMTPKGVVLHTRAWKDTADTQRIRQLIKSGTTLVVGDETELTTTAQNLMKVQQLNPDGDVAWTNTTINALQVGQRSVVP